jgi:hypothetical protein
VVIGLDSLVVNPGLTNSDDDESYVSGRRRRGGAAGSLLRAAALALSGSAAISEPPKVHRTAINHRDDHHQPGNTQQKCPAALVFELAS